MKKPVILVVDDEADTRSSIIGYLSPRFDCDYKEAEDGCEAVDFVKDNPCDVIILDIKMPKKGGLAVIKEVKEIDPTIEILVVSAWDSDEVAEEAYKMGATDYAIKPVEMKALGIQFSNILAKRGK